MTVSTLVDRVKITVLSSGIGPFQLGAAVPAYRGVEALTDGSIYSYATEAGTNYEAGTGTYVAATNTFVRSPQISSASGAPVAFPANIQLNFTVLAADIQPEDAAFPLDDSLGVASNAAISQRAATAGIAAILDGSSPWDLPDEANGDVIPSPGSKLPYLSAGVLKIA